MSLLTLRQEVETRGLLSTRRRQQGRRELQRLAKQGFRVYPARPLSYSSLKEFARSPLHYLEYLTRPKAPTAPMTAGKVFEVLLFGQDLSDQFVVFARPVPEKDFRTKANREARDAAQAEAASTGRDAIEQQDLEAIRQVAELALRHPFMKRVQRYAFKHPAQRNRREPISGLKLTGIPDLAFRRQRTGVDIKFVGSVAEFRQRIFGRSYAYWIQAAMYSLIYGYEDFYFFAMQSQPHHYAQAFYLDPEALAQLRQALVREVLLPFRWCLEHGFTAPAAQLEVPDFLAGAHLSI